MTTKLIENLLIEIGLTENETKVYLVLLTYGPLTYNETSQHASINRTTCYAVAKRLVQEGLVREDLGQAIVKITAEPPSALLEHLRKEQASVTKRIELAKRATSEIQKLIPGKHAAEPRLTYIDEPQIIYFLYKRTEKWNASIAKYDNILWGFESAEFEHDYQEYIKWFWDESSSQSVRVKLFSDDPNLRNTGANPPEKAEFKFLPEINFTTNIWVYGDYIIMLSLEEHPYYLLEMKEPLFARNFREYFKAIWNFHEKMGIFGK